LYYNAIVKKLRKLVIMAFKLKIKRNQLKLELIHDNKSFASAF